MGIDKQIIYSENLDDSLRNFLWNNCTFPWSHFSIVSHY